MANDSDESDVSEAEEDDDDEDGSRRVVRPLVPARGFLALFTNGRRRGGSPLKRLATLAAQSTRAIMNASAGMRDPSRSGSEFVGPGAVGAWGVGDGFGSPQGGQDHFRAGGLRADPVDVERRQAGARRARRRRRARGAADSDGAEAGGAGAVGRGGPLGPSLVGRAPVPGVGGRHAPAAGEGGGRTRRAAGGQRGAGGGGAAAGHAGPQRR